MDTNPSTINKLIGAEVASYRELEPKNKENNKSVEKDLEIKKDKYVNDGSLLNGDSNINSPKEDNQSYYASLKPLPESPSTKINGDAKKDFKRKEDIHVNDVTYEQPKKLITEMVDKRSEDAYSYLTIDEDFEDNYAEQEKGADPIKEYGAKNIEHLSKAGMRALSGAPKKRWYKPEIIRKYQAKKHYKKIRQDLAKGAAGIAARKHGVDEEAARNLGGIAEKAITRNIKGAAKAFFKKKKK